MLKHRLLTAIILIPLVIWLLSLSSLILAIAMGIIVTIGAWEWAAICGWQHLLARSFYCFAIGLGLLGAYWFWQQTIMSYILMATCLWWLVAFYWVIRYQQGYKLLPKAHFIKALLGFFILIPTWIALLVLHKHEVYGWHFVVFLLVLIWSADSGAYFAGRRWGKTKLANQISPKKTWEGVGGALLLSSFIALGYVWLNSMPLMTASLFLLLSLITVVVSILGDLFESLFKRQMDIKDSGQILPGHGGILDRIDSLTAAAPIFVTGLIFLGKIF